MFGPTRWNNGRLRAIAALRPRSAPENRPVTVALQRTEAYFEGVQNLRRVLTVLCACALTSLGVPSARGQESAPVANPGLLLIASMGESTLSIIDEATWRTVAVLATGSQPHEVRVSPDQRHAFVVAGRTITAVDLVTLSVARTFDLGEFRAHDVRISRDGRTLWAACAQRRTVLELDAETGAVRHRYDTARDGAWFVEVTPDEQHLITPNLEGKSVSVIDRVGKSTAVIPLDASAYGIDVSPDGAQVWVSGKHLSIVDTRTARLVRTLQTTAADTGRLRLAPDGRRVIVAMARSLVVLEASTGRLLREVSLAAAPKVLTVSGDGARAYVTHPEAQTATVIDLEAGRVIASLPTGARPDGIAWARRAPGGVTPRGAL